MDVAQTICFVARCTFARTMSRIAVKMRKRAVAFVKRVRFSDAHTVSILQNFGLRIIRGHVSWVSRTLLVCESISSGLKDLKGSIATKGVTAKVSRDDQHMPCKEGVAVNSSEPSKVKVLEYLSEEYDCSASLPVISKRTDLSPSEFQDMERESNATRLSIPDHWSQMPYMTRYQRVWLSPYSDEFELVEELFRSSIEQSVTIIRIERVQNPFMWEKYQRCVSAFTIGYTRRRIFVDVHVFIFPHQHTT